MAKFDSEKGIPEVIGYFSSQLKVWENFIDDTHKIKNNNRSNDIFPLMLSIATAGKATLVLAEARLATEFFVIARCFLERTVNYTYLMAADKSEIESFIDHGIQKGYLATAKKKTTFNKLGHNYKIQYPNEWLDEKINKFTKKGRPQNWTHLTFQQRLGKIKEFCDEFELSLYMNLYEDGSEAVHGGFYGTLFHTGILSEATCPVKGRQYINTYVTLALYNLANLISAAFKATVLTSEQDLSKYMNKLEHNHKVVSEFFEEMKSGKT